jgi:hypothetical protein
MMATPPVDPIGYLGREFIAYIANCDQAEVDAAATDQSHPEHGRVTTAVKRCRGLLASHGLDLAPAVANVPSQAETSVGNALRVAAGGKVPKLPPTDGILSPLAEIARDMFPALLLEPVRQPPVFGPELSITPPHRELHAQMNQHPAALEFRRRLRDDQLGQLLEPDSGAPPYFTSSSGSGLSVQAESLPSGLIGAAAVRARLLSPAFNLATLVGEIGQLIDDLRLIQDGREINVPAAVSLPVLNCQPGLSIELPWGWLHPMDSPTLKAVGDGFAPYGSLLVTTLPTTFSVGDATAQPAPNPAGMRTHAEHLERNVAKTMLTLLVVNQTPRLVPAATRIIEITPTFGNGWGARAYGPDPVRGASGQLVPEIVPEITRLAGLVETHFHESLEIPTRRLVAATSVRHDIADALVDAVVSWESLFTGSDSGELRFRISAAIAWLLADDGNRRLDLHREITRLYDLRSRILHRGVAEQDLAAQRDRAVELGCRCLRGMLERHPELISDKDRGKKLILVGNSKRSRSEQA